MSRADLRARDRVGPGGTALALPGSMSPTSPPPRRLVATRPLRRPVYSRRHARADLRDLKVLVVDDDRASAKILDAVFRSEGCDVRLASSAEDALELIAQAPAELVLIDLVLPLMSGLLLAQSLRAQAAMRDSVLVAVTAFHGPGVERATREAGFDGYLRKPFEVTAFVARVRGLMENER